MNNDMFEVILNLISIMLGYENLIENRQQSEDNNVEKHNQKQAKQILDDLHLRFDKQDALLVEILNILKGEK